MVDEVYQNALKEVNDILENTDEKLVNKIPIKFIEFIKTNMNKNDITNINPEIEIDKQKLLGETESILSLIYRTYWATDEEKKEFSEKDLKELLDKEVEKKGKYKGRDVNELFNKSKKINENSSNNNMLIVKKEGIIKRIFNKIWQLLGK